MCHARTTKGSQLNLDEVDEILSSFFKPAPATTAGERLLAEEEDGHPGTQAAGDPRTHTDTRDQHRKAMTGPRAGSNAGGGAEGGGGAAAEVPAEGEDRQTAAAAEAEAVRARDSFPPGDPPNRPPRCNARARKKIRFTGELGAFLDGEGMWSDVAVMEAERKAGGNILPQQQQQQQDGRIQHQEQKQDGHGSRGEEEGREQEETQKNQGESKQEEQKEVGVVGAKGGWGEAGSEDDGRVNNDGWQAAAAAAAGNGESPSCPVVAADPRGSPVSSDPTSTSTGAGDESPVSLPAPKSTAAPEAAAAAAVVGGGNAAGDEKK